ncbi:MAG TPA: hypothetical protein VKE93_12390 [Candidatus Angelobacter sp.]|nr:hypothetical protein [Candidatus Angelobacter sp.]
MDPFAKKMLLGVAAFGSAMVLMAGVLAGVYFHNRPPCKEEIVSQVASPGKQWVAEAYERRCSDPVEWLAHVNLRRKEDPISTNYFSGRVNEGEVFLVEQRGEGQRPELEWTAPDHLTIRCATCKFSALRRDDRWGPVTITYEVEQH